MTAALSEPSITSSAASIWALFRLVLSGAASETSSTAGIILRFRSGVAAVHPFADGAGHVAGIFLDEPVQHVHGHHAGLRLKSVVSKARRTMAIAVAILEA